MCPLAKIAPVWLIFPLIRSQVEGCLYSSCSVQTHSKNLAPRPSINRLCPANSQLSWKVL